MPEVMDVRVGEQLAVAVEQLARRAGEAILAVYSSAGFDVEVKADESPLTLADRRSHAILAEGLEALRPGILLVSEEGRAVPYAERRGQDLVWIVDPLDGTKEFVKRNGEFCVCVALVRSGLPVLGVIHAPVTGKSYLAWRGGGAAFAKTGPETPLRRLPALMPKPVDSPGLRFSVSRSHLSADTEAYLGRFASPNTVAGGSALKFCAIAEGEIDIYPRHAPTMEWDTAAGQLIVEEAGGRVIAVEEGTPLRYNREHQVNGHFVATGNVVGDLPLA